jgi:hypothetical protein
MPVIAAASHMSGGGVPASRRAMTVATTPAIDWLDRTHFQHWVLYYRTGVEYSPIVIPSWQDVAAISGLCHHDPVASRARATAAGEVTPPI